MTYREWEEQGDKMKDFIACISGIAMLVVFVFIVGTVGAVENDSLDLKSGMIRVGISLVVMILCVIGIRYSESGDDIDVD